MNKDPDSKLRQVLGTWQVSPPPAPRFNAGVWGRIATEKQNGSFNIMETLRELFFIQLTRPAYAAALLVVTAAISATAASEQAYRAREQYRLDSARQYLASIDPTAITTGMPSFTR